MSRMLALAWRWDYECGILRALGISRGATGRGSFCPERVLPDPEDPGWTGLSSRSRNETPRPTRDGPRSTGAAPSSLMHHVPRLTATRATRTNRRRESRSSGCDSEIKTMADVVLARLYTGHGRRP